MTTIKELIDASSTITVLTGAGVSVDSGIPDFKSIDSHWGHEIPRHEAISLPYFRKNPDKFWQIYRELFESKMKSIPNPFHNYLAELEETHDVTIVTQNVDGLHTLAGSSKVFEMHGSVDRVVCTRGSCSAVYSADEYTTMRIPKCKRCHKILKPDVCLFGEAISHFDAAVSAIEKSDLLIVAGTSLEVAPVSLLPSVAENSERLIKRLWINKTRVPEGYSFTDKYIGKFSDFLKLVNE